MQSILGLFGRSPFRPMQEHMGVVSRCAAEVTVLIDALAAGEQGGVQAAKDRIFALEQQADDIKNEIRAHLPKSLFMPVDRRDLLEILDAQDSIADTAQDIAGLCVMKELVLPPGFNGPLQGLVAGVNAAVGQCLAVINELDELLETGFRGKQVERVEAMVGEIGRLEGHTDEQGMALAALLYRHDGNMTAGEFFLWNEMIVRIGDLADYAQDVGDRLRLLIAR